MVLLVEAAIGFATIFLGVYLYFQWCYTYWSKRKIPFLKPSFPGGNLDTILPNGFAIGLQSTKYYDEFRSMGVKYGGVYTMTKPMLILNDLDVIKTILIKDFQFFLDRGVFHDEKSDKMSSNLFTQEGQKWKSLRNKLTPAFTSGKIKALSKIVGGVAENMVEYIETKTNKEEFNIKDVTQGYTIDVIGNTVFGIQCNSFKDKDTEFKNMAIKIFDVKFWLAVRLAIAVYWPKIAKAFRVRVTDPEIDNFFTKVIEDNVKYREANKVVKQDLFQSLLQLKNSDNEEEKMTMDEVSAQAFLFFIAGFDTSSSTMMFTLLELARNPQLQEKAREDVLKGLALNGGKVDNEAIKEMKYLSQVVDETLRLYPIVPTLTRVAVRDYTIPDTTDIIEKGTVVGIPVYAIQRDPKIWPNPTKFDPERFSEKNKSKIHAAAYLPFGDGPRSCIGNRFGLMQAKVGLSVLLKHYKFTVHPSTKYPIDFHPTTFTLFNTSKILLKVEKITQ